MSEKQKPSNKSAAEMMAMLAETPIIDPEKVRRAAFRHWSSREPCDCPKTRDLDGTEIVRHDVRRCSEGGKP